MLLETKYTDINATLRVLAGRRTQFTHAEAPIPAIGFIGRGYVVPNISITGEFTFLKLPTRRANEEYSGKYYDFDLYGTVNFN